MRSTILPAGPAFVALLLLGPAPACAEVLHYEATISPSTEVPPVTDSKATGHLNASYDPATMVLTYEVGYADLTGPAAAAHFHGPAPAGKNAPVWIPVTGNLASPIKGSAKLTDDQAKALANGELYFNIHTPMNKGGEMRGQVIKTNLY